MALTGEPGRRRARRQRLSRSAEFDRVYREGRSHASRHLVLYAFPRSDDGSDSEPRLGVSVGRKVGGAVERNRMKRLLREAFWASAEEIREGRSHASRHLVVYAFPRADDADSDRRLGVSVGRKVGGAVERNRMKRLLREAFWASAEELREGHDFVIVARPAASELARQGGEQAIETELREVLTAAGLAQRGEESS